MRLRLAWVGLLCAALPGTALAQTETRAAVAEALYRQARDLMAKGLLDEACPKFAESQRLDPATGTLLNLASCHERQGKLATAWLEYSDAMVAARRDAREDRVEFARERVADLEPKLSRLTILLAADADAEGLTLELDGANVGRAVVGAPFPVDPGEHRVRASAPGKTAQVFKVQIGAVADQQSLTVSKLADAPAEPAAAPAAVAPAPGAATLSLPRDELTVRPTPSSVYIAGGITLALAASAGATGITYLHKKSAYEDQKTSERRDDALTYGRLNLGLWIGAALSAGVTTYLYATRPERRAAVQVTPLIGPQVAGLGVAGGF
ncbi:MAG TPA: hypothetical protein VHB79_37770 [Polyangiaceae bacterium]|nr:hypothetical protein [Polyangiaceae bacterium]